MKANPAPEVVALLETLGASFDVASRSELEMCLALGVHPVRLSYGNTIKKSADIAYAFACGVRRFAFDSEAELRKLAAHAAYSEVMCRLQTTGENAGWSLSKKFGCDLEMTAELAPPGSRSWIAPCRSVVSCRIATDRSYSVEKAIARSSGTLPKISS